MDAAWVEVPWTWGRTLAGKFCPCVRGQVTHKEVRLVFDAIIALYILIRGDSVLDFIVTNIFFSIFEIQKENSHHGCTRINHPAPMPGTNACLGAIHVPQSVSMSLNLNRIQTCHWATVHHQTHQTTQIYYCVLLPTRTQTDGRVPPTLPTPPSPIIAVVVVVVVIIVDFCIHVHWFVSMSNIHKSFSHVLPLYPLNRYIQLQWDQTCWTHTNKSHQDDWSHNHTPLALGWVIWTILLVCVLVGCVMSPGGRGGRRGSKSLNGGDSNQPTVILLFGLGRQNKFSRHILFGNVF